MQAFDSDLVSFYYSKKSLKQSPYREEMLIVTPGCERFSSFLTSLLKVWSEATCGIWISFCKMLLTLGTTRKQWTRPVGWPVTILLVGRAVTFLYYTAWEIPKQAWLANGAGPRKSTWLCVRFMGFQWLSWPISHVHRVLLSSIKGEPSSQ